MMPFETFSDYLNNTYLPTNKITITVSYNTKEFSFKSAQVKGLLVIDICESKSDQLYLTDNMTLKYLWALLKKLVPG